MRRAGLAGFLLLAALVAAPWGEAEEQSAPMRVRFELPGGETAPGQPAQLTLIVEADPSLPGVAEGGRMELLLWLPPGVQVASPGWKREEFSPEEREGSSGPWVPFERTVAAPAPGAPAGVLVQEPLLLAVTQEGLNWVVSIRAKTVSASGPWQASAVVFATRQGEKVEFHAAPRRS